jgi:hypothetical protein
MSCITYALQSTTRICLRGEFVPAYVTFYVYSTATMKDTDKLPCLQWDYNPPYKCSSNEDLGLRPSCLCDRLKNSCINVKLHFCTSLSFFISIINRIPAPPKHCPTMGRDRKNVYSRQLATLHGLTLRFAVSEVLY